jgi:sugar lactone lactonase YvrE
MIETRALAEGLIFPEAPRWHDGKLWFSDIHDRRVKTCDLSGQVESVVTLPKPERPSGLGFLPDGRLLIVGCMARQILRLDPGGLRVHADLSHLVANYLNDMVVDARGRAYVGNLGFDFRAADAVLQPADIVAVDPDGSARVVADGLGFPNGSVVTPDGRTLVIGETYAARFTAFDIDESGSLSNRRVWAQFDALGFCADGGTRVRPDGCCLDAEGAIWVASPGLNEVLRVREGGEIVQRVRPSQIPYACALGGPDRRTLFVLTASTHTLPAVVEARSGRIETLSVEVPGAGLP